MYLLESNWQEWFNGFIHTASGINIIYPTGHYDTGHSHSFQ